LAFDFAGDLGLVGDAAERAEAGEDVAGELLPGLFAIGVAPVKSEQRSVGTAQERAQRDLDILTVLGALGVDGAQALACH
jgi:hypothetical protein